jgi:hypothetical protein
MAICSIKNTVIATIPIAITLMEFNEAGMAGQGARAQC